MMEIPTRILAIAIRHAQNADRPVTIGKDGKSVAVYEKRVQGYRIEYFVAHYCEDIDGNLRWEMRE